MIPTKMLAIGSLGLFLHLAIVEADLGAYPNPSETKALTRLKKKDQISHLPSVKEGILTTPDDGPGEPKPTSHESSATAPKVSPPSILDQSTTLRIGTEVALHQGIRPVGTADGVYGRN